MHNGRRKEGEGEKVVSYHSPPLPRDGTSRFSWAACPRLLERVGRVEPGVEPRVGQPGSGAQTRLDGALYSVTARAGPEAERAAQECRTSRCNANVHVLVDADANCRRQVDQQGSEGAPKHGSECRR